MSDIAKYLNEELCRLKVEDSSCSRDIKNLTKENNDLNKKINELSSKYDSTFNVFHAETEEKLLDQNKTEEILKVIEDNNNRINELNAKKNEIEDRQKLVRKLITEDNSNSTKYSNTEIKSIIDKAEFILQLIDVDNTRAKVEILNLINILKDYI